MTNEEARQIIATWLVSSKGAKGQLGYIEGWFDEKDVEAFSMAIETLSTERTGEWVELEDWNGDNYYDCSVCGESFELLDGTPSMNLYHYCPNCGAKMKGADDE